MEGKWCFLLFPFFLCPFPPYPHDAPGPPTNLLHRLLLQVFWFEKPTKSAMKDDDAPGFRHAPDLFLTPWHWTAQEIVQFRSMAEDEQIVACKADNNNIIPPLAYLVMPISVTECVRQAEYSRGTARVYETNSTTTLFWHPADKMISFGTTGDMIAGAPHKREPNAERLRGNRHDFFKQRSAVVESLRCANPASLVSALTNTWNWLNNNYGLSPLPSIEQTFTTEWINWRASHP